MTPARPAAVTASPLARTLAQPGTLFYFVAMRPDIVKAVGDKFFLTPGEAADACEFVSGLLRTPYKVYQAEVVNITLLPPPQEARP
jgi:hypothetical protein